MYHCVFQQSEILKLAHRSSDLKYVNAYGIFHKLKKNCFYSVIVHISQMFFITKTIIKNCINLLIICLKLLNAIMNKPINGKTGTNRNKLLT